MNKQEIKKAIEELKYYKGDVFKETISRQAVDLAISALEHQLTNGWIPASERLPKEHKYVCGDDCCFISEDVLCSAYNEDTCEYETWVDYTIDGEWQTHEYYEGEKLAWQPLPDPYKELATDNNVVTIGDKIRENNESLAEYISKFTILADRQRIIDYLNQPYME